MSVSTTRRQALGAIAAAAAIGAVPTAAIARGADRSAWNRAVARLNASEAAYAVIAEKYSAVGNAAEAACPRVDEFFSRYNMGCGQSRDRNFRAAHMSLVIERAKGRHLLTEAEAKQITADAYRIVDDFETWGARRVEAFREVHAWEDRHDEAVDDRVEARKDVLATDAPDQSALLFKVELLAKIMREACVDDADSMDSVTKDARRLLTAGRAA